MKQILISKTESEFPNFEIDFHKEVEFFIDGFVGYSKNKNSFKILYIREPNAIMNFRNQAIANNYLFDAIITFDSEVLKECKNSYFFPFGTTWIHNYNFPEKKFQISHLTGFKTMTEGHILRQKIHYKQNKISNPKDFYISKHGGVENFCENKILKDMKEPLFESQFHICIENSRENNYFTEKIMDCFATKTVPIYWGCPNIGDFFDLNGIICFQDINELFNICNNLNESDYEKMNEGVENNFNFHKKYINLIKDLEILVKKILEDNKKI